MKRKRQQQAPRKESVVDARRSDRGPTPNGSNPTLDLGTASDRQGPLPAQVFESIDRLRLEVDADLGHLPGRTSRGRFEELAEPLLQSATRVVGLISPGDPEAARGHQACCDRLAQAFTSAMSSRLQLDGDDGPRNLLYCILTLRRLLQWPIGEDLGIELQERIRNHTQALWGGLGECWRSTDPSQCWFTPGAVADPDASLILDYYRVKEVFYTRCVTEQESILVPRSRLARWIHEGRDEARFDPTWAAHDIDDVQRQIVAARQAHELECQQLESAHENAEQEERERLEAELQQFEQGLPGRREGDEARARRVREEFEARKRNSRHRVEEELNALAEEWKPNLTKARDKRERTRQRSFYLLEVPLGSALGSLAFVAAELAGLALSLAVPAGALLGVGLGLWFRRSSNRSVAVLEERFKQEASAIRARGALRLKQMHADLAAEPDRIEQQIEQERERLRTDSASRLIEARGKLDTRLQALGEALQLKIENLQESSRDKVRARPRKDAEHFPVILEGLEKGFQKGRQPSKSILRVMHDQKFSAYINSLTPKSREALMRETRRLPRRELDELMECLISSSASPPQT